MSQTCLEQSSDFFLFHFQLLPHLRKHWDIESLSVFPSFSILEKMNAALRFQAYIKKHKLFQSCAILNSKVLKIQECRVSNFPSSTKRTGHSKAKMNDTT